LQKVLSSNSGFWNDMLAVGGLRKVRNFPAGDLVNKVLKFSLPNKVLKFSLPNKVLKFSLPKLAILLTIASHFTDYSELEKDLAL
jgi:hypothetical protein